MAVPTATEYVEVDGLPLRTTAWAVTSLASLYDTAPQRGQGIPVAYHDGEQPPKRWLSARTVTLPLVVFGDRDPNGAPYANKRVGLRRNADLLKRALRPRTGDLTVPLIHRHPDGDREARCQMLGPMSTRTLAAVALRAVVDLWLPDGVLRSTTPTTASGTGTVPIPNPGSTDQYDLIVTLTGSGPVTITTGDSTFVFDGSLGGGVTIDTGAMTAVRGGSDVHGLVVSSTPRWLVVPSGGDTWTVSGGSVAVSHRAPWL